MGGKKGIKRASILLICMLMVVSLISGCTQQIVGSPQASVFTSGTYTSKGTGFGGELEIEVSFSETEITDVKILNHSETKNIGDLALERIKNQIVSQQTLAVEAVSGATRSSNAILEAVEDAVKQAGGNVEALKSNAAPKPGEGKVEKLEADVVVVGGGASGVSAAVAAGDKGAKVILLEKTAVIGGASNLSWAGKFFNSSIAVENNVVVNLEEEIAAWVEKNAWRVDAAVIRQYVTQSGETFNWLADKGYVTQFLNLGGEQMHLLPPYADRQAILRAMLAESVEKNGGQVITETTAKKLITNEKGEITGVIAEMLDGSTLEITAKSVVLATGGYAANSEMVKEFFGFEGVNGGLGQNVGEGLAMAWEAGARVPDNIGGQMLHQTLARATEALKAQYEPFEASYPLMLTYLPNFMNVGVSGARFRDEAATLKAVAAANTSAFHGPFHYVIVSQQQLDSLTQEGMKGVKAPKLPGMPPEFYLGFAQQFTLENPWENASKVFDSMVENGHGFKGDTLEELAQNAGMDVELFVETFKNYEEATKTGVDVEFGKSADYLIPMGEKGPYYAIVAEVNNLGSIGGVLINRSFQILNQDRIPMKGLYAVGVEAAGVLYNDTYIGNGVGIGYAFTSGRLGGEYAANYELEK